MAITNYATLTTAVQDFAHRSDISHYVDTFLSLAEQRIGRDLRVRELEASDTGTLSGSTLSLPTDFSSMRVFKITASYGDYTPINVGLDGLAQKSSTTSGVPAFYSIVGGTIAFNRTPDSAYPYQLDYYKKPSAVSPTNTTTDLLTAFPEIYLFACLIEVADFTKNDRDIQRYTQKYAELVKTANGAQTGGPMQMVNA